MTCCLLSSRWRCRTVSELACSPVVLPWWWGTIRTACCHFLPWRTCRYEAHAAGRGSSGVFLCPVRLSTAHHGRGSRTRPLGRRICREGAERILCAPQRGDAMKPHNLIFLNQIEFYHCALHLHQFVWFLMII